MVADWSVESITLKQNPPNPQDLDCQRIVLDDSCLLSMARMCSRMVEPFLLLVLTIKHTHSQKSACKKHVVICPRMESLLY